MATTLRGHHYHGPTQTIVLGNVQEPENLVRWVARNSKPVLQQRWSVTGTDSNGYAWTQYEWRDVPTEQETP